MDGAEVFNFTLKNVPRLVSSTREVSGDNLDYYLFHQANKFMLNHLVKKMKINSDVAPINIDQYGNTSSVSIPLLMTTALRDKIKDKPSTKIGMFGFGVGYSWAAGVKVVKSNIVLENIFLK